MKRSLQDPHLPFAVIDAVETLNEIAEADFPYIVSFAQEDQIHDQNETIRSITSRWHKGDEEAETAIQEIFRVILRYLHSLNRRKKKSIEDRKVMEGIKDIMAVVGEAAKKLDQCSTLFHETQSHHATGTREYRALQDFYWKNLQHRIEPEVLSRRIFESIQGVEKNQKRKKKISLEDEHQIVDLETGKSDQHYELFFLRKENGSRFYSSSLLRNMQLVCDFGGRIGTATQLELPSTVYLWMDLLCHETAKNILDAIEYTQREYFEKTRAFAKQETVSAINKALMSLMMAAHAKNLLENSPAKSCREYFLDFHQFLRISLQTGTYQKWIAYPPLEENHFAHAVLDLLHALCFAFFSQTHGWRCLEDRLEEWIDRAREDRSMEHLEAAEESNAYWNLLASDTAALKHLFYFYPNGPLRKNLSLFEHQQLSRWDPLMQGNLPTVLFDLYLHEKRIVHNRFPAPVIQEKIDQAVLTDEWRGFVHALSSMEQAHHLLINLQDRTSWYEHARAALFEQNERDPLSPVTVVTLAMDTDFYHQRAPFDQESHADRFIRQILEQLRGEQTGFHFPETLHPAITGHFAEGVLLAIHRIFFGGRNVLAPEHRRQFIDLFYLFLIMKCIDIAQPSSFSLTCKDGVDVGPCFSALLFGLLKSLQSKAPTSQDLSMFHQILFLSSVLMRERLPQPYRLERMLGALRRIEQVRDEMGDEAFQTLIQDGFHLFFDSSVLEMRVA